MYEPNSIKIIRDIEKDKNGLFHNNSYGLFLKILEIDGYEVTVSANIDSEKYDNAADYVKNEFESLFVKTDVCPLGKRTPRMSQRYKSTPVTEGFYQSKFPNIIEYYDALKKYAEIILYVEENIIPKDFHIVYNREKYSAELAKEIEEYMFKERYGDIINFDDFNDE